MTTDTEIKLKGMKALTEAMGPLEAERFVALILREPFDYTKWQRDLWGDASVEEISQAAMAHRRASRAAPRKPLRPARTR